MDEFLLNIAATCVGTTTLGPGLRSAVWVQGCDLHCPGCVSPEWIPKTENRLVSIQDLADELISNPSITGITISGGEPMLQAKGLSSLIQELNRMRSLNFICFTGFQYESLITRPPNAFIGEFLSLIDLLVDGPYIQKLNNNLGLRGSTNQRFIHLTDKLSQFDFETQKRQIEYQVSDGQLMMVGVPPVSVHQVIDSRILEITKEGNYVRS